MEDKEYMKDKEEKILHMKNNCYIWIFTLLTALVIGFIFSNSLRSQVVSDEQSKTVASVVDPTINPQGGVDDYEWLNVLVRKLAHMAEFALLGAVLYGLIYSIYKISAKWFVGMMLFASLAVAVLDETIQYLVPGRTPLVSDILIDFVGAILGIMFGCLLSKVLLHHRSKTVYNKGNISG